MIIKKKIVLEIEAQFGSEWQKTSALDALTVMLKAWDLFYQTSHKNNKIKYKVIEE